MNKRVFDEYVEKDEYEPYELMMCPICGFKKFKFIFFLNRHCKKIHNMNLRDALIHHMNRMVSLNKRISYIVNGLSYRRP